MTHWRGLEASEQEQIIRMRPTDLMEHMPGDLALCRSFLSTSEDAVGVRFLEEALQPHMAAIWLPTLASALFSEPQGPLSEHLQRRLLSCALSLHYRQRIALLFRIHGLIERFRRENRPHILPAMKQLLTALTPISEFGAAKDPLRLMPLAQAVAHRVLKALQEMSSTEDRLMADDPRFPLLLAQIQNVPPDERPGLMELAFQVAQHQENIPEILDVLDLNIIREMIQNLVCPASEALPVQETAEEHALQQVEQDAYPTTASWEDQYSALDTGEIVAPEVYIEAFTSLPFPDQLSMLPWFLSLVFKLAEARAEGLESTLQLVVLRLIDNSGQPLHGLLEAISTMHTDDWLRPEEFVNLLPLQQVALLLRAYYDVNDLPSLMRWLWQSSSTFFENLSRSHHPFYVKQLWECFRAYIDGAEILHEFAEVSSLNQNLLEWARLHNLSVEMGASLRITAAGRQNSASLCNLGIDEIVRSHGGIRSLIMEGAYQLKNSGERADCSALAVGLLAYLMHWRAPLASIDDPVNWHNFLRILLERMPELENLILTNQPTALNNSLEFMRWIVLAVANAPLSAASHAHLFDWTLRACARLNLGSVCHLLLDQSLIETYLLDQWSLRTSEQQNALASQYPWLSTNISRVRQARALRRELDPSSEAWS